MNKLDQKKRIFTSSVITLKRKLIIDIPENIFYYFNQLNFSINSYNLNSNINKYSLDNKNYDTLILNLYNKKSTNKINNIESILYDNLDLSKLSVHKEYSKILNNKFICLRIKRDILNNMNKVLKYNYNKRNITIISKNYELNILNDILSIFDLFDKITNNENTYKLQVFLSDEEKKINNEINYINADSINSGSTYPGFNITLWRREEMHKVLIHELVHYLKLDMYNYQHKFYKLYEDINLKGDICNPNEAYTEFLALIFFTYWKFKKSSDKNIKSFFKKKLLIELGWSYFQIAKILTFFKCYIDYESLFTKNCKFIQKTNVLSYFVLKCFMLQNFKKTIECIDLKSFKATELLTDNLLETINLKDKEFADNINWAIRYFKSTKYKFNHLSLRMSCLD